MASWAARGPGISWASVSPSLYSASEIHRRRSTRSRCIYPTRATGPPNPTVPSFSTYKVSCRSEYAIGGGVAWAGSFTDVSSAGNADVTMVTFSRGGIGGQVFDVSEWLLVGYWPIVRRERVGR